VSTKTCLTDNNFIMHKALERIITILIHVDHVNSVGGWYDGLLLFTLYL